MRYEWDEAKAQSNLGKHGISFETAKLVFEDPQALSSLDEVTNDEERWQTFGAIGSLVVMVAHTWWEEEDGEDVIRIVSARKATSRERTIYEAHKRSG